MESTTRGRSWARECSMVSRTRSCWIRRALLRMRLKCRPCLSLGVLGWLGLRWLWFGRRRTGEKAPTPLRSRLGSASGGNERFDLVDDVSVGAVSYADSAYFFYGFL